jgi:hypothetical protein
MRKQVYLFAYGYWADIIKETDTHIGAIDIDGINTVVVKDGMELVRWAQ